MSTAVFVTAATGQLGHLVVTSLLKDVQQKAITLTVGVRDSTKVPQTWTEAGVKAVQIDYADAPQRWTEALQGQQRILLISGNSPQRLQQHRNVLQGAQTAKVDLFAYTSILHGDGSPLAMAADHTSFEQDIKASGLQYVLLRNGWYAENYYLSASSWTQSGAIFSAAGKAKLSLATRADYAEAAAQVLRPSYKPANEALELAGDEAVTLDDIAAEASRLTGQTIAHKSLPEAHYAKALEAHGVPGWMAAAVAQADAMAESQDALLDHSKTLSKVIGRPTQSFKTPLPHYLKVNH